MKKYSILTLSLLLSLTAFSQTIDTNYESQKKKIIKMEFFSPLTGNTTFGYEEYIKDWFSWEARLGIIGLGTDNAGRNPAGVFLKAGPKFKLNPDFVTRDLRGSHLLSGRYIRPEIVFSTYGEDVMDYSQPGDRTTRETFSSLAIMINYGRQFVLADIMSLDWHIGIGYGSSSDGGVRYHYGHTGGQSDFPIAFSAGFTIGVLIK